MEAKQFKWRSRTVLVLLLSAFLTFLAELYQLQIVEGPRYREQSTRQIANTVTVAAARGEILDRYGRVLVTNRASYQVTLDPKFMKQAETRNATLLRLLEICQEQDVTWSDSFPITSSPPFTYTKDQPFGDAENPTLLRRLLNAVKPRGLSANPTAAELLSALRTSFEVDESLDTITGRRLVGVIYEIELRRRDLSYSNYIFARDVEIGFITAVKEAGLPGVKIEITSVREYATSSAAHLLGSVGLIRNWDDYKDKGYSYSDTVGIDGVEQAFEDVLRGTSGTKDIEFNQNGKIIRENWHVNAETGEVQSPKPGNNVMLTIDLKLQEAVEQALERHIPGMTEQVQGGACVVTDMTGGLLAMASYPDFDPATYRQDYNTLLEDPMRPLLNRALQGLYAPGSIFKPAVAIGALNEGVITRTEEIEDTGRYQHYERIEDQPQCWIYRQYRRTHGFENVSEAIRDSCNIFFYETGLRLGIDKIDWYASRFGLGQATGIELFEKTGEVAGPETSQKHLQTWYEGDTMYAAIGQGNTQVTPLQMANYAATLANGGSRYAAHLLYMVKSSDFSQIVEEYQPQAEDTIEIDPANLEAVKYGMEMAANESSVASYFENLPVRVGLKTGSAQVARESEANATMVAFAPYDDPEIAVSVVVEKGGAGAKVAPIMAEVLSAYFSAKDGTDVVLQENTLIR